jgi:3',5'-cyclic AMP phosphodiesterase CpdA
MRLVQISDTHFGTERPEVMAALQRAVVDLQPQALLLCGDITQRARRSQFAAARRFMDSMPASAAQIVIPGNHDLPLFNLWARAFAPYRNYQSAFGAREASWSAHGVQVLALDATHRLFTDGVLPASRLRHRLAAAASSRAPEDLFVVAAHQPLWTAWEKDRRRTLMGRQQTARLFAEARVDLVLSGHVHVPLIETSAVVDVELPWQFVLSGAGTAVSHRTRVGVPNSFNAIVFAGGDLTITQYDYGESGFAPVRRTSLRRTAQGWATADRPSYKGTMPL